MTRAPADDRPGPLPFSERVHAVAAATADAFRDLPPPQAGDQAAGIRFRGFPLGERATE